MRYDKSRKPTHDLLKETGLTYDDYAAIDDGNRYELAGGKLELMSPAPLVNHQMISFELQKRLSQSCEGDYIILYAPVDLILSTDEVRQPDIVLIHRERKHLMRKRGIEGAPDLVIEILSPSTLKRDKIDKLDIYARYKIPEYWIVEPNTGMLEQYILIGHQYDISNVFYDDEPISSPNMTCVSFAMKDIMDNVPELKD
ncbi:Endonuclease, Uma2 family (restriction endonuclease fold) [Lentibacillus halodurans]|uniref:Endonuclease, Uma2 family (Restriction endonuclease fold) n=1 Tax=Lentibacillus halodurans TaxID=237679 RepID=A0A1I0WNR5_9BACI|nr:Uma2 family endonuclease [Lentibacillus halodurans]SFA90382.1 Endonuclease, Uma2 family (restriction endonuclease fold) [Lentibacillus halodurans]